MGCFSEGAVKVKENENKNKDTIEVLKENNNKNKISTSSNLSRNIQESHACLFQPKL